MPSSERQLRIALLIDADNAPAEKIDEILTELSTLGEINVRRAYGNWTKSGLQGWQKRLLEFGIRPIQQFDYSKRKNATDMAMTVDAMELLYNEHPEAFGIVSSDADFTPLVMHLRSKGSAVYGFGAEQTPRPFVNACSRFLYLESLGGNGPGDADAAGEAVQPPPAFDNAAPAAMAALAPGAAPASVSGASVDGAHARQDEEPPAPGMPARPATLRVPPAQLRQDTRLMDLLRHAVQASADEEGWARVGAVGTQIGNKTSFDARNYGYATLSRLFAATQAFELRDEGTPRVAVRDKRAARPLPG